ncbi:unnamed protein product [Mesocestoides corti]|uniref:DUF7083 domain-containing protein n=1 Tax=Mesocestoides corti TaxID=53468 RepID=A0A0R3UBJ2_MESCO|nr:unnamed protein product [Mesocestoides corti]
MLADPQSSQAAPTSLPSIDGLTNSISEFSYDPENGVTFESWYRRFEDLFRVDLASQDDTWKVRLLTRKLGPAELKRYIDTILPKSSLDFTFGETVQNLKRMFGELTSLFSTRYQCLKLEIGEFDDFLDHLAVLPPPIATLVKTNRDQLAADRSSPPRQGGRKRQKPTLFQVDPKKKRY